MIHSEWIGLWWLAACTIALLAVGVGIAWHWRRHGPVVGVLLVSVPGWLLIDASTPDPYSTEPLVADMNELTADEPPNSFAVYVTECTGEGSFPAHANVTLEDATLDTYRARASGDKIQAGGGAWSAAEDEADSWPTDWVNQPSDECLTDVRFFLGTLTP